VIIRLRVIAMKPCSHARQLSLLPSAEWEVNIGKSVATLGGAG